MARGKTAAPTVADAHGQAINDEQVYVAWQSFSYHEPTDGSSPVIVQGSPLLGSDRAVQLAPQNFVKQGTRPPGDAAWAATPEPPPAPRPERLMVICTEAFTGSGIDVAPGLRTPGMTLVEAGSVLAADHPLVLANKDKFRLATDADLATAA